MKRLKTFVDRGAAAQAAVDKIAEQEKAKEELFRQINSYLNGRGWNALVMGPVQIERAVGALGKYTYRFVVEFTGGQK